MKTITLNVIGMVELVVITIWMVGIVFAMLVNALTLLVDLELVKISGKTKNVKGRRQRENVTRKRLLQTARRLVTNVEYDFCLYLRYF